MAFVLALDQGTTSSRALVVSERGEIVSAAQREFTQHFPRPGWVEHDPDEIWSSQFGVAQEAMARAGLRPRDVAAIGITNQRETTLVWDRASGRPLHNAIVWQDRRTARMCEELSGLTDLVRARTGLVVDPYFSGTKLAWLLENVDGLRSRADRGEVCFGTVDSWLVWHLTGGRVHATDVTNASRTLLFDIHRLAWDNELLDALGIPRSVLPEVRSSSEVYAQTAADVFASPIPIAGIAGDQHAALFGQRCTRAGMVKNTYGTGCFLLMQTGRQPVTSQHGLVATVAWQIGDEVCYALEGSVFIAGAVVQWLRDGLGVIREAADVEALAARVPDADGLYLVPAFTGLGAPHWDPQARGTIVGITRGTTAAHLARAALEGIAFQVADVVEAMQADARVPVTELRADGGAAANDLLLQIQSDMIGVPVVRPTVAESTALGAAYLAGLAVGVWDSPADIDAQWTMERRFEPEAGAAEVEKRRAGWRRALERSQGWALPQ